MNPENKNNTQIEPENKVETTPEPIVSETNTKDKKVGPIITTLIIVLILIIAALYIFASRLNKQAIPDDTTISEIESNYAEASTTVVVPITNESDDLQSLESDLQNSTNGVDDQNF